MRKRGRTKERSSTKKKVILIVCAILALFILFNIGWFTWRAFKYAPYSSAMTQNAFSNVVVPRYAFVDDEGYDYNVKYPDYLSFTGNLCIGVPTVGDDPFTDCVIIWPKLSGAYEYGVILYEDGNGYQIYVDDEGNPLDSSDDEIVERHKENLKEALI